MVGLEPVDDVADVAANDVVGETVLLEGLGDPEDGGESEVRVSPPARSSVKQFEQ